MSCAICFDSFNKSSRAPTKCPYCSIEICRTCLQTYLLNDISDTPRCINPECGHGYNREFLDSQLTKTFRLQTFKQHREKVLCDREKAKLPSTQDDAHAYKEAKQQFYTARVASTSIRAKMDALYNTDIKMAQMDIFRHEMDLYRLKLQQTPRTYLDPNDPSILAIMRTNYERIQNFKKMFNPLRIAYRKERRKISLFTPVVNSHGRIKLNNSVKPTERKTFVKPCPSNTCKGFLSTAWKCGLCEMWTCPDCHEIKGLSNKDDHTCDPNKKATAELLAKEAKSCPKCGVQICKIEGCDQMWCTHCNTGFNWRTGTIANGPIHNPHYFDWLRSQGQAPVTTAHMNCDFEMDRQIANRLPRNDPIACFLQKVWNCMREQEDQTMYARHHDYDEKCRILRVRFLTDEIDESTWKINLQRLEKDARFQTSVHQIRDVFVQASKDILRHVLLEGADLRQIHTHATEMITYCNSTADAVGKRFGRKVDLRIRGLDT